MDKEQILSQLGLAGGLGQESPKSNQALIEHIQAQTNLAGKFQAGPSYDYDPNHRYAYLMEGIDDEIEARYGKRSDDHKNYVKAVTTAMLETAEAHTVDGRVKSHRDIQMESIARRMPNFRQLANPGMFLTEDTLSPLQPGGVTAGAWTTLAMGMVRRLYPKLLAFELFSVQPMRQPTWRIFFENLTRDSDGSRLDDQAYFDPTHANISHSPTVNPTPEKISWDLDYRDVTAVDKALSFETCRQAIQDIMAYWSIDIEQRLLLAMEDEMLRQIDGQLLLDAFTGATAGDVYWDPNPPVGSDPTNTRAYEKTIYHALVDGKVSVAEKIYKNPSFIIGHTSDVALFEKLEDFKFANTSDFSKRTVQRHVLGTLDNQITVYADPWWANRGSLLIGYKGQTLSDTGLVYSPYKPMYLSSRIEEMNMTIGRSMLTRYASTLVNGDCYARIHLSGS